MDSDYRGLEVFWAGPSQEPLVSWKVWIQSLQLIAIAKEVIDIEDLLQENGLPNNSYPTVEEPPGTEDQQAKTDREARNTTPIAVWRDEGNRRAEYESRTFKESTWGDVDKLLNFCHWENKERDTSIKNIRTVRL